VVELPPLAAGRRLGHRDRALFPGRHLRALGGAVRSVRHQVAQPDGRLHATGLDRERQRPPPAGHRQPGPRRAVGHPVRQPRVAGDRPRRHRAVGHHGRAAGPSGRLSRRLGRGGGDAAGRHPAHRARHPDRPHPRRRGAGRAAAQRARRHRHLGAGAVDRRRLLAAIRARHARYHARRKEQGLRQRRAHHRRAGRAHRARPRAAQRLGPGAGDRSAP
jgi:hypothetical protein